LVAFFLPEGRVLSLLSGHSLALLSGLSGLLSPLAALLPGLGLPTLLPGLGLFPRLLGLIADSLDGLRPSKLFEDPSGSRNELEEFARVVLLSDETEALEFFLGSVESEAPERASFEAMG